MSRTFTAHQKMRALSDQDQRCAICDEPLDVLVKRGPDRIEFDHAHCHALGGASEQDNCRAVHKRCHLSKTARDIKDIAKTKRLAIAKAEQDACLASGRRKMNAKERALAKMKERRE